MKTMIILNFFLDVMGLGYISLIILACVLVVSFIIALSLNGTPEKTRFDKAE